MAHELHFGAWLRQERRRRSLTREEFATLVGCALGTLAKLESNTRRPSKPMLTRMLAILAYGVAQHERNHWGEMVELWAAVLSHHPDCAARSAEALGAAVQLRAQWAQPPAPYEQALLDATAERVRAHLGAARYQQCWRHGSDHPTEIVDQLAAAGPELEQLFAAADQATALAPSPPHFAEVERTGWEIVSR